MTTAGRRADANAPAIAFLDVDGVLNVKRSQRQTAAPALRRGPGRRPTRPQIEIIEFRMLDERCIAELSRLLWSVPSAMLVTFGDWRLRANARATLATQGLAGPWHDDWRTDEQPGGRGAQIDRWLALHGNPRHVILAGDPHELWNRRDRTVIVPDTMGLTRLHADRARDLLIAQRRRADPPS